jgi:hypothetical protein
MIHLNYIFNLFMKYFVKKDEDTDLLSHLLSLLIMRTWNIKWLFIFVFLYIIHFYDHLISRQKNFDLRKEYLKLAFLFRRIIVYCFEFGYFLVLLFFLNSDFLTIFLWIIAVSTFSACVFTIFMIKMRRI